MIERCDGCGPLDNRPAQPGYCPTCGEPVAFVYDYAAYRPRTDLPGLWQHADLLPVADRRAIVSLGEGNTPLIPARLSTGLSTFWKDETRNPTGSMKDRSLAVSISKAKELGCPKAIIASTGSAGIAAAAYTARAGIALAVLVPAGTSPDRLATMALLGAEVIAVRGSFEQIMDVMLQARREHGWYLLSTARDLNPFQAEGPKSIAYEIAEQLGRAPDAVVVPIGGGGTLAGIWRGFQDLLALGRIDAPPRLYGVQNVKYNALALALERGLTTQEEIEALGIDPFQPTVTPNLKHAVPPAWETALAALRQSGGGVATVADEEALAGQAELARREGVFVEASSAVVVPGLRQLRASGQVRSAETVVAVLTGSGFRDVGLVAGHHPREIPELTPAESLARLTREAGENEPQRRGGRREPEDWVSVPQP
ncbi:MAG: pyridoxal-phosphate dependent enzyme [Chloroflexi bacterium]|nr:pyridoxal-phosphate dependent enzyme [Chloroflexota bacterium]